MRKTLVAISIALSLLLTPTHKAQAGIGALIGVSAVMTIGGLITATGVVGPLFLPGNDDAGMGSSRDWGLMFGILFVAPVGLLILDGEGDIEFAPVELSAKSHQAFSAEAIEIYNSEVDQLNAISSEIQKEISGNQKLDASILWKEYGTLLSPETLEIAAFNGKALLESHQ